MVVRAADTNLVLLPDSVDFLSAAALGCRFATAFRALTGPGRLQTGEWLAVWGCGGVGLSLVMIATALGAHVVAVDPSGPALQRAGELGAERLLTPAAAEAGIAAVGGVSVSVDASGSAPIVDASLRGLRRHGRHVQVGLMHGAAARASLAWDLVVSRELEVLGAHGDGSAGLSADGGDGG